jgi:hypothetical protein
MSAASNEEQPTLVRDDPVHGQTYAHPAYGMIGVSRVEGDSTLFGSDFVHRRFMEITISRAEVTRTLSNYWHHGREELIRVKLSFSQWATFLSSPNVGSGVPCTIARDRGEQMPDVALAEETDAFRDEVRETLTDAVGHIERALRDIEQELGASLSQKKRDAILGRLRHAKMEIEKNVPFVADQFDRHVEKKVETAKVEVNAYMDAMLTRAGRAALAASDKPLLIGGGDHE